jgi:ribosomal protein S18 acetylase RimI-like enzyme
VNVRPATREDFPALAELFATSEEAVTGRPSIVVAGDVDGWLHTTPLETNTWLFEEGGTLLAGGFAQLFDERANAAGTVHPSAWGRGLGAQLLDLIEARMVEEGGGRIHCWTVAGDTAADELFSARGYREVRRFWDMEIQLEDDPPEPDVAVEPMGDDARGFHAALEEAFADHWEHRPESFEDWWGRQRERSNYDPSLWFVVRDGDEVAAAARNEARETGGYVGALGVRRAWRGRGYGRALLLHTFREFRRRGLSHVALGVDAANPTGATRLYESVGMEVALENVVWAKALR